MYIINKFSIIFKSHPFRVMYSLLSDGKYYKVFENNDNVVITEEISKEEYASQLINYIILNK